MSQQENIATTQRLGEAINSGNLNELHSVFAPNVIDRDPDPNQGSGPEGFIRFFTGFRTAFPDLHISVEQLVADEDNVAIAYTITGTHKGELMGIPATGRQIKARGVQIARFEKGQIVERWGSSDQLGILQQIGVKPLAAG